MKKLAVVFLVVVAGFAGCRSRSGIGDGSGSNGGSNEPPVVSHHYELVENDMKPLFGVNIFDHEIDGVRHNALQEAVALVKYMKEQDLGGGYYELGNENDGPWNAHDGQQLTIDQYLEKYIPIARAMKEADPTIKLLGPAVSGYDNPNQHRPYITGFIEGMRGKGELVDYFSYHYYGETWIDKSNNNRINLTRPQELAGQAQDIRGQLAAAGLSHVKLAITEITRRSGVSRMWTSV